jgi:hypothetical protein
VAAVATLLAPGVCKKKLFADNFISYTYIDEAGGGREVTRWMSPRVALISILF